MPETKLEAARRKGDLTAVIGAMREEAHTETATAGTPAREQVDVVDGAIRLAAHLTGQGKTGAERRQALSGVQVGRTVTAQGSTPIRRTRAEKLANTLTWANGLTEEQREAFIVSERFDALTDRQQEGISEAFGLIEDRAYEDSIGIANVDLDAELPDVDAIVGDEEDGDAELDGLLDTDYESLFETAGWESEQQT
jgi:hypothetical protein